VTGSLAERNLLGAIILAPNQLAVVLERVTSEDFADGRLGQAFDIIATMAAMDEPIDPITVANRIIDTGIRLGPEEALEWPNADVLTYAASEYADAVRTDSLRRGIVRAADVARERLGSGESPAIVATDMTSALTRLVDGTVSGRMQPKSLRDILDVEDEEPDWVIEDLLERHDRLVITGPEGGGKSTLVRQLVILSAAGWHPLWFRPMFPVEALVVDAENTERQWRRAVSWMSKNAMNEGQRDPAEHVHIMAGKRIDITSGSDLGQIHRMIDKYNPDIVYIGPLYKLVPHAINNDDDAAPLITALDSLRERGVALVMEAHAGHATKFGGERDLRPRGSSALLGWPEFGFGIQPLEEHPNVANLVRWRGDREERHWPRSITRGYSWPWEPYD
jgi:hypothetical protein